MFEAEDFTLQASTIESVSTHAITKKDEEHRVFSPFVHVQKVRIVVRSHNNNFDGQDVGSAYSVQT